MTYCQYLELLSARDAQANQILKRSCRYSPLHWHWMGKESAFSMGTYLNREELIRQKNLTEADAKHRAKLGNTTMYYYLLGLRSGLGFVLRHYVAPTGCNHLTQ